MEELKTDTTKEKDIVETSMDKIMCHTYSIYRNLYDTNENLSVILGKMMGNCPDLPVKWEPDPSDGALVKWEGINMHLQEQVSLYESMTAELSQMI